jgi:ABC-type lipoprotein export system ATPase subunit
MVTHAEKVAAAADRIIFLKDGVVTDCNYKIT